MLSVCATPIGNLDDVTLRVLRELREADVVLCEDTRHTRRLLDRHGIDATLLSYHEHNEARRVGELLPRLETGARVALVSDAGLPAISDPGARLIAAAVVAGIAVTVLPGASAVETALVASGLVADAYSFVGFLPRRERELQALLGSPARDPVVAFESPQRLPRTLALLAGIAPERDVAVCRELTKVHEEIVRGTAEEVRARFESGARGEVVLVLGAWASADDEAAAAHAAVEELVTAGASRRAAAKVVARLTGVAANRLYRESL
jgi:16S rRNA (cytidine1402-2'-O)-methyltransferase